MAHVHTAGDKNVYYLDQLCTIGFCGALGVVQILLWNYGVLNIILDPKFHMPVLLSGIVLTALAVVRAIALWVAVGQARAAEHHDCDHDHEHHHDHDHLHDHDHDHVHEHSHEQGIMAADHVHTHDHDHAHGIVAAEHVPTHACGHDHGHEPSHDDCGHEHGWAPWRYVVLLLPLLLFLLGMPWPAPAVEEDPLPPGVLFVGFQQLQQAAYTPETRQVWEGQLVRVKGQFAPSRDSKKFRLYRMKMTCCAADAYPLNVEIESPASLDVAGFQARWVNVTGVIHFRKASGRDEYLTIMEMRSVDEVKLTGPDSNPFLTG
jgi:hypothetical protein